MYAGLTTLSYYPYLQDTYAELYQDASLLYAFLASFVLYAVCHWLWARSVSFARSMFVCCVMSYLLALVGSALLLHVEAYLRASHETVTRAGIVATSWSNTVVLITWSCFYFGIKHYISSEERRRRLDGSELAARDAQLRALQYQLQPHFLFNVLNAISSLVVSDQKEEATRMIARLADLLRNSLDSHDGHFTCLSEEIELVERYLDIERSRFGSRLEVTFDVQGSVENAMVPRWLLQPLVENAIRHGISRRLSGGRVAVRAHSNNDRLLITVENDLEQSSSFPSSHGAGVGLSNTRSRLACLYGEEASLETEEEIGRRYVVSVQLPLRRSGSFPGSSYAEAAL